MTIFLARAGKFGENENYFLENNVICMVWQELAESDFSNIKTQEQLKEILLNTYQEQSKSVPNWASQIWIHLNKMKIDDLVILPLKHSRKIAVGKIVSDYIFDPKKKPYSHIRKVEWIEKEIPRTSFDQDLLYSFGAFKTFCEINRNDAETRIKAFLSGKKNTTNNDTLKYQLENATNEEVNLEEASLDQISKLILAKFKGKRLEALVESIFKAKGYFTYVSPAGADGGVDILAAKGDLGFENPKICIQVKSGTAVGIDILDRLSGTMKKVKADFGLLVSWEGFKGSIKEEKKNEFFTIRLWEQKELVEEFLKHYHKLDEEIKSEVPLKQIWVIADEE
jgi:restriction system protein